MSPTLKGTTALSAPLLAMTLILAAAPIAAAQDATIKVGGRLMIDHTIAELDGVDGAEDIDINDTELRRGRLKVSGTFGPALKYKLEANKTGDDPVNLEDAYVQFVPVGSRFKITVGQDNTPNSLDELTSSLFISTLERSAFTDAFAFDRRVGVMVSTSGDNYTVDVGAYTNNLEAGGGPDKGHAFAARGTFNPIKTDDMLVHLGASWRYRDVGDTESDLRYRQRPYTHVAPSRIIDTGRFAESDNFLGAEAAVINGGLWAAGEYAVLAADGSEDNPDADFDGYYAEIGYFFGGQKVYKGGKFNRPKIDSPYGEGGLGAVSVVARYDVVDLQDEGYTGELETVVLGVDWWPTKQTRVGLNYFDADAENGAADKGSGLLARVQFDF